MAVLMTCAAAAAAYLKPHMYLADTRSPMEIAPSIPVAFGGWKLATVSGGVVNPQQQELVNTLYSEVISRVYVNRSGDQIMLSIAYGKNQSDSLQVHKPEVCYPAQGYQVISNRAGEMATPFGRIPVRRLETSYGSQRREPVTYWTTLGDHAVLGGLDKRLREIWYGINGYIADGLLFRVSSIDSSSSHAFEVQAGFVNELLAALSRSDRLRLAGLGPSALFVGGARAR